jgi:hypothetical protein
MIFFKPRIADVTTQHKNKNNAEKYLFLGNDTTRDTRINKNITT